MSTYYIEAADVLFFKDGREIAPGSEYSAASIFPPNPGTLYGALRSSMLTLNDHTDFSKNDFGISNSKTGEFVGTKNAKGYLFIQNFLLARKTEKGMTPLFKLPFDVLKRKKPDYKQGETDAVELGGIRNGKTIGIKSNMPLSHLQLPWITHEEGAFFKHEAIFIEETQFYDYLMGEPGNITDDDSLAGAVLKRQAETTAPFVKEPRIGIVINGDTHTVEESKLFTTPFIRLENNIGFWVELNVDEDLLPNQTKLRLGGDGKVAMLSIVKDENNHRYDEQLEAKIKETSTLKLVLTTPAIFEKGWIPDGIDPNTGQGIINGVPVRLVSAALGKHQNIGGWDVANNHPKPTRRAIPAGSVYYIQTDQPGKVYERIHKQSICADEENRKQGLGITYTGVM